MKDCKQATSIGGRRVIIRARILRVALPAVIGLVLTLFLVGTAAGAGVITRVSTDAAGGEGNSSSYGPSISGDGRYIAFESAADNLVPGDTNGQSDVFVKDTVTGATSRVSTDSAGAQTRSPFDFTTVAPESKMPSISADGRYVAFVCWDARLVPGDTNQANDVFVKDTVTGSTSRVSTDSAGQQGTWSVTRPPDSLSPSVSADGRYVSFVSYAINLVPGDTNLLADIFVKDTVTGATSRVSTDSAWGQGNSSGSNPFTLADGRYVAFDSAADNLVPGDTNGARDVFVKDTVTGAISRVSTDSAGGQGNGGSYAPSASADGRYVAFYSDASNLDPYDFNGAFDVFVKDTANAVTSRVSVDASWLPGNGNSVASSISADGRYVAFHSNASNLVQGDGNGTDDVFLAATSACSGTQSITLNWTNVYWNDYAAYLDRLLNVGYTINNTGTAPAYDVRIVYTVNTNGVTFYSATGGGFIPAGGSANLTVRYYVPAGVASFNSEVHASALDACGNINNYP